MKKTMLVFFLAAMTLSVFAQNGVIKEVSGTVELKAAGSTSFVLAKIGDTIAQNTTISTGFKSMTLLEVGSTVIAVRPLTRLTLTEIRAAQGAETINVNLQAGRVRVDVNPPAGTRTSMAVTSPSATASVRGTKYRFDTRNIHVSEGVVSFRGRRGYQVLVGANDFSGIGPYGNASPPYRSEKGPKGVVGFDPRTAGNTGGSQGGVNYETGPIDQGQPPDTGPGTSTPWTQQPTTPAPTGGTITITITY